MRRLPTAYVYKSDGIATVHYCPFLDDEHFDRLYWSVAHRWPGGPLDLRWRIWLLIQCAQQCAGRPGNFAEFGVYRGASAFMMLSSLALRNGQVFYLFDTFTGIPSTRLTEAEVHEGFPGRLGDTSAAEVAEFLKSWQPHIKLVVGDVLTTAVANETGPLCFAHVDLNAASATTVALDYVYDRLTPGGVIVLDDYGWSGCEDQRSAIDAFFSARPEQVVALPTGQALVVKC